MGAFGEVDGRPGEPALADPGLAPQHDAGRRSACRPRPASQLSSRYAISSLRPTSGPRVTLVMSRSPMTRKCRQRPSTPLTGFGSRASSSKSSRMSAFDRLRNGHGAGIGEAAHPCGEVRREAVDVVLGGIQVDESAVDADPDVDVEAELAAHRSLSSATVAGDVQPALHGSVHVVLVGVRMAEHGQQPVALGGGDVAFVLGRRSAGTSSR